MAAWAPILKASMPYITQIITTAIPAFTSKPEEAKVDPIVAKQIEELQRAATVNAESLQTLAEKLKETIQGIDSAAVALQKDLARQRAISFTSMVVAILAGIAALISFSF